MRECIITIGREFGSGGHIVGELLSESLNLPYYDNELILLAAQRGGIDHKKLYGYDEKSVNSFLYKINYEGNENVKRGDSMENTLFELQKQCILEIAASGGAVIVGRCADVILKDAGYNVLSIFIAAPFEERVKRTQVLEGLDRRTVVDMTKRKDKTRKKYYQSHTGKKWGTQGSYDLFFNSSVYDNFNDIVEEVIRKM